MPGLPRTEYSHLDYASDQDPYPTGPSLPIAQPTFYTPADHQLSTNNVRYIPAQMDVSAPFQ